MAKLTETVYQSEAPRVDATAGILYGVKVLGEQSRNGRRYVAKGMREAAPKYEGIKSYIDHPDRERVSEDRKFSDWSGVFRNPRYVEGQGIFADLHLRKTGDHFDGIIEAAEKFPTAVGFSHVAEGDSRLDGETEIVESIREVFSVDLVTDPATTAGFFESKRKRKTVRDVLESLPDGAQRKRIVEMLDDFIDAPAEEANHNDPVSHMASLLKELIAMLGQALNTLAAKDPPPPAHEAPAPEEEVAEQEQAEDEQVPAEDENTPPDLNKPEDETEVFESVKRELALEKAKNQLLESGREATPARIKALANVTDKAERKELLDSWPGAEVGERPLRSPAAISESTASPEHIHKRFESLLK